MNKENTQAQMRRGILEFCILLVISRGKVYVAEILKELKRADLIVVEGTIYPLLTRFKNSGILEYSWEESKQGPPRKYYSLTKSGEAFLKDIMISWNSLDRSINSLIKKFK
ncbi:PadR family transcriptional regulator [Candidatus Falkowbacteria bacterium RIFOXYB2_FULL_34_18]|uniref:PadR family transcriptional regulator n=1 Tax=Candidatus Falkowbacteria bacterium RIFOXYD2_FULL_34_120 TaxID=1798007 RepID=A0A1F5TQZ7_9BACT|nr:MAG: PadR family transcriptional regulator [Candidatus Falkowbacteria bacterium RIFOXYB2_FULL_34_18]OGF29337.1 MAG: PadR family transcriptional regulator [Candidatus Falkowbacteria bacterium RIFOXYC12_FULL_34_55]OGF36453.1 MAG: PadR family transcriptional regulator [Candidatus Falkowbacteria bacterium RIFOXYC2_FULL_34_220]OGF38932.1 MAG: PadR family transcriptional regulator [Candidatus Falkowbacteria bacterium RIFOXYD12_FULL_34_57]OGF40951.1 MAG: PadR family transcriptional regulator [Candi